MLSVAQSQVYFRDAAPGTPGYKTPISIDSQVVRDIVENMDSFGRPKFGLTSTVGGEESITY